MKEMTREILKKLHVRVVQILHLIIDFVILDNRTKIRLDTINSKLSAGQHGHETDERDIWAQKRFLVATHAIAGYDFNKREIEKKMLKNRTSAKSLRISMCYQHDHRDVKNQYGSSGVTPIATVCAL